MNIKNRTLYIADNLNIMRNIDPEIIDLIYLDPPFNTKKKYKAPIGSKAEGASFKDIWTDEDVKHEWYGEVAEQNPELYQVIQAAETLYDKSMKIYLMAMAIRLFEMHRILKPTGSIYLHCDPTASHYLKMVMDSIFGKENFQNEVIWKRTSTHNDPGRFGRIHDTLLFYTKKDNATWNSQYEAHDPKYIKKSYCHQDARGRYRVGDLTGAGTSKGESGQPWRGVNPTDTGRHWAVPRTNAYAEYIEKHFIPNYRQISSIHDRLNALDEAGLIYWPKKGTIPRLKGYLDSSPGRPLQDIIADIKMGSKATERTSYPTQKPLALLECITKASSNEGDMVLDPFCGCATACVAAENLGRQWVGIDMSESAEVITKLRLQDEVDKGTDLWNPIEDVTVSRTPPQLTHPTTEKQIPITTLFSHPPDQSYSQTELQAFRSHKHRMYGNQEGRCNGCKHPFPFRNMTIDHIRPKSKNGTDEPNNLQLLCGACNSTKGNRSQKFLIDTLEKQFIR